MNNVKKKDHICDFNRVIVNLKKTVGAKTDKEVADLLDMSATAFAERKRRNSLPMDKIHLLCTRKSIDVNVLLAGESDDYLVREKNGTFTTPAKTPQVSSDIDTLLNLGFEDPNDREAIQNLVFILRSGNSRMKQHARSTVKELRALIE